MRDNGKTYFDLDALERRREAEKAVVEAAKEWAGSLNGSPMPLLEAVAALRALDANGGRP